MRQLFFVALVFGCSDGNTPKASDPTFTMQLSIAAGMETTLCQFVKMPPGKAYVISAHHQYTPGSHHMLLYRTDVTTLAAGMDQVQDCYEGGGGTIMSHVRGVLYGSQEAMGSMTMPDGVGFEVQSEEVLLLQVHYLNATMQPLTSKVEVTLHTTPTPVPNLAGVLFFYDPFIDVPPAAMATANARCTLPQDVTLLGVYPHYHSRGVAYQAYLDLPSQAAATDPFYTSTDWTHPAPWTGGPMKIAAGTAVRWYCDYDNSAGNNEFFQGPSALTNEMCMFTGAYYPAMDVAAEQCRSNMSMFGSGTATCGDALTCLQACNGAPPPMLGAGMPDVDPCWQKCFVKTCPSASDPLLLQLKCLGDNCQAECAAGNCSTCAQQKCLSQSLACINATCN